MPATGTVTILIPHRRSGDPFHLLVDSTGVKMRGDGEWQVRKCGPGQRRQGRKVHLAMDTATGDIRAGEVTPGREGDSPVLPDEPIGTVTADGAFDTRRGHSAIIERGATAIIPIQERLSQDKRTALPPGRGPRSSAGTSDKPSGRA